MLKNKLIVIFVVLAVVLASSGCATPQSKRIYSTGTIIKVTEIEVTVREQNSGHSLKGAIIGGALGSTIGDGDGKKAAIATGALIGAIIASDTPVVSLEKSKEVEIEEDGTSVRFKSVVDNHWASGIKIGEGTRVKYYTEKWWATPGPKIRDAMLFESEY